MPIREVCSPVNAMKLPKGGIEAASKASRKVQHAPVYGPPTGERSDAVRPAPGVVTDGNLLIKHTSADRK
jgi:hypothetical protein